MARKVEVEFEAFGSPFFVIVELDEGDERPLDEIDFRLWLYESSWVLNAKELDLEEEVDTPTD